MVVCLDQLVNW